MISLIWAEVVVLRVGLYLANEMKCVSAQDIQ